MRVGLGAAQVGEIDLLNPEVADQAVREGDEVCIAVAEHTRIRILDPGVAPGSQAEEGG